MMQGAVLMGSMQAVWGFPVQTHADRFSLQHQLYDNRLKSRIGRFRFRTTSFPSAPRQVR